MRCCLHLKPACSRTSCLCLSYLNSCFSSDFCERMRNHWLGSREHRHCCCRTSLVVLELVLLSRAKLWRTFETISGLFVLSFYHQPELVVFPLPLCCCRAAFSLLKWLQQHLKYTHILITFGEFCVISCDPELVLGLAWSGPRDGMEHAGCINNIVLSLVLLFDSETTCISGIGKYI